MPAHLWELRFDPTTLERAAVGWTQLGDSMTRRADDLVDAARRALDGWDADAADSYDEHRRQVIANLDQFTTLTGSISSLLRAVSGVLVAYQKELDQAWLEVSAVPHDLVGESRLLVFRATGEEDRALVTRCEAGAEEIRRRLALALDQEGSHLRDARAEFMLVRATLTELTGSAFPTILGGGPEVTGVGTVMPASTSVLGSAQSGVTAAGLPPIAPISVSMPDLTGISAAGITPIAGAAAAGAAARRAASKTAQQGGMPPMGGGMAGGAMRGGAGAMRGGAAGRRTSSGRLAAPKLATGTDEETRAARAREAEREAKRAALADRRAERAARRAERDAERDGGRTTDKQSGRGEKKSERRKDDEDEATTDTQEERAESGEPGSRPAGLTVVEVAPGEAAPTDDGGTDPQTTTRPGDQRP